MYSHRLKLVINKKRAPQPVDLQCQRCHHPSGEMVSTQPPDGCIFLCPLCSPCLHHLSRSGQAYKVWAPRRMKRMAQ